MLVVASPASRHNPAGRGRGGGCRSGSDVELAWRLDAAGCYGPPRSWLVVTGANGRTTTTSMLHAMLIAGGRRAVLCRQYRQCGAGCAAVDEPAGCWRGVVKLLGLPSLRRAGAVLNIAEPPGLACHDGRIHHGQGPGADRRVAVAGLDDSRRPHC